MTVSRLPLVNLHVAPQAQVAHVGKRVSSCKQTTWARQFIQKIREFSTSALYAKMIRNLISYQ